MNLKRCLKIKYFYVELFFQLFLHYIIEVILYRNQLENVVKTASKQNTYSISAYADASTGTSGGYGTMLLVVVDDTYGHGTKRVYN